MAIWALGDLHLSFGVPDKSMDPFGERWQHHPEKIERQWKKAISSDDLVLIPGDISWAMRPEEALPDLEWIHALPGTKLLLRGNHDYWWTSLSKLEKILPSSLHLIQNNMFAWKDWAIGGARLWDTPEFSFGEYIEYIDNPRAKTLVEPEIPKDIEKIYERELNRLELSLKCFPHHLKKRIAMTHYPPISSRLEPSRASAILEKYGVNICVFGHLHNVRNHSLPFGTKNGVQYILTSCDYCDFTPVRIA